MSGDSTLPRPFILVRVLDRATRPPVLTAFAILQALLLAVVGVGHLATRTDPAMAGDEPGTGDFAAFFTGAVLIREGRGPELYDFESQKAVQDSIMGESRSHWQPYINPPALAMALAPASALGYAASFVVFAGALALALVAALVYLMGATPGISRSPASAVTCVLLTMGFLPVALTTFGGQNTALSLALLSGVFAAVRRGNKNLAGVLLGILTFKPQYAILLGFVLLVRREMRVVVVAGGVGLLHYALATAFCGIGWPLEFLAALASHAPVEMANNAPWHFSLPATSYRLLPEWAARMVVVGGSLAVLAAVLGASGGAPTRSSRFPAFFGMVVAGMLLLSPHLQYYEAGILVLPVLLTLESILSQEKVPRLGTRVLLAGAYFGFPAWQLSEVLGFQPLLLVLLALFAWAGHLAFRGIPETHHQEEIS